MPVMTTFLGREVALYDLSVTLDNASAPVEPIPHHIQYVNPREGVRAAQDRYGIDPAWWPAGLGWSSEQVTLGTHSGTHIDAPYHYGPRADGGAARTIDDVPLDWCVGPGLVLDCSAVDPKTGIRLPDVTRALEAIHYVIHPGDIVLIRTDNARQFGQPHYADTYPGLRQDACGWLLDQGVRVIGIDAWGLDRPMRLMAEDARGGRGQFWETHLLGREHEYLQIEKLTNLDTLPVAKDFWMVAFPSKIKGGSAGWTRAVAMVETRRLPPSTE